MCFLLYWHLDILSVIVAAVWFITVSLLSSGALPSTRFVTFIDEFASTLPKSEVAFCKPLLMCCRCLVALKSESNYVYAFVWCSTAMCFCKATVLFERSASAQLQQAAS